jgi:hypothetical protein
MEVIRNKHENKKADLNISITTLDVHGLNIRNKQKTTKKTKQETGWVN